jgi:hypothetical protein
LVFTAVHNLKDAVGSTPKRLPIGSYPRIFPHTRHTEGSDTHGLPKKGIRATVGFRTFLLHEVTLPAAAAFCGVSANVAEGEGPTEEVAEGTAAAEGGAIAVGEGEGSEWTQQWRTGGLMDISLVSAFCNLSGPAK